MWWRRSGVNSKDFVHMDAFQFPPQKFRGCDVRQHPRHRCGFHGRIFRHSLRKVAEPSPAGPAKVMPCWHPGTQRKLKCWYLISFACYFPFFRCTNGCWPLDKWWSEGVFFEKSNMLTTFEPHLIRLKSANATGKFLVAGADDRQFVTGHLSDGL